MVRNPQHTDVNKASAAVFGDWVLPRMKGSNISVEAQEAKILLFQKFEDNNWLDVFNLRTGFLLLNVVPVLRPFIVRWACTFLVNGVIQAWKDDEWDDYEIFLKHFCPTISYVLKKKFPRQDVLLLRGKDCAKLVSILLGMGQLTNVIVKGASQRNYYNLYYTAVHLLLQGIFKTDAESCNLLRDKHFRRFRVLLSAFFSVPAQNKIWAKCVAEVIICTIGAIEDSSRDDILVEFIKCFGAGSQVWKIEKSAVLGLILNYLPPHLSLELVDLFVQDQLNRVLTPHKCTTMAELTDVIQRWVLINMTLGEGWTNKTANLMKTCVWIFKKNLGRMVVKILNRGPYTLLENDLVAERIRSYVQDCSPPMSPLPVLLEENMNLTKIEKWFSTLIK